LIAAVGAFLGLPDVLFVVLYFCLSYGLFSFIDIARFLPWKQIIERVQISMISGSKTLPPIDTSKFERQRKSSIPLGFAILLATILTIVFRRQTLSFFGMS
jgi:Flp pilus assembly protein protease CpaA